MVSRLTKVQKRENEKVAKREDACSPKFRNILIFGFTFVGDSVLATCVIDPLRRKYPDAQLTFVVGPAPYPILNGDPRVDHVLVYDQHHQHRGLRGRWMLLKELRQHRFDLVVDLRDSLWARLTGGRRWGLRNRTYEAHAVTRYLSALRGMDVAQARPLLHLTREESAAAAEQLGPRKGRYRVAVHPGANWQYKRWPARSFAVLCNRLIDELAADIVLIGGPDEHSTVQAVTEHMKIWPLIFNESSLREVAAIISQCDHYVGNDTGPMHLAVAVDTPVTALFASTDHRRSGPYGAKHQVVLNSQTRGCEPCHPGKNPGHCRSASCATLDAIPVDQVFQVIRSRMVAAELEQHNG